MKIMWYASVKPVFREVMKGLVGAQEKKKKDMRLQRIIVRYRDDLKKWQPQEKMEMENQKKDNRQGNGDQKKTTGTMPRTAGYSAPYRGGLGGRPARGDKDHALGKKKQKPDTAG